MKILNLYAGIGGNRQLWTDCDVTAVEYDSRIADVYAEKFPDDTLVVGCALDYVEEHFMEFNFIWASPPCPSHGQYRHNVGVLGKGFNPIIPDMTSLYGLIVFLKTYHIGLWCVENVKPYYGVLVPPTVELQRHFFWSNFDIEPKGFESSRIRSKNKISDFEGYEAVASSSIPNKRQVLRNQVNPQVGLHVLNEARKI